MRTNLAILEKPQTNHRSSIPRPGQVISALALGAGTVNLPGIHWVSQPHEQIDFIATLGPVSQPELTAVLDSIADPALPVADFTGVQAAQRDFVADAFTPETFAAACEHFRPIWQRLATLPFRAERGQRPEMAVLRLAYARDVSIKASFTAENRWLIAYPLLGSGFADRERLEALATATALRRRHFTRTHLCIRCASARLLAFEACPGCGGSDLADERIVHHYRCGCQEPESRFIRGRSLVCPKCRRELRHFGMDYGKTGIIAHCRTCGASHAEPDPRFACLDCSAIAPAGDTPHNDWFHYDITELGLAAMKEGRLPGRDDAIEIHARPQGRPIQEFRLLATAALRSSRRFGRPFSAVEFASAQLAELRKAHGAGAIEGAMRQILAIVVENLPESDFAAITNNTSLIIGLPETSAAQAAQIVRQIQPLIMSNSIPGLSLLPAYLEGEALVERLSHL